MIKVNCPNCSTRLTAPDELVGKPVNCQKCNTKFVLSKRWMNAPIGVPAGADGADVGDRSSSSNSSDGSFKNPGLIGNDSDNSISSSPLAIVAANFDLADAENGLAIATATAEGAISTRSIEALSSTESLVSVDRERAEMKADMNLVIANRTRDLTSGSGSKAERNSENQSDTLSLPSGLEAFSTTPIKGFVETNFLLEFFDFRFRRYLAPGIIRLSWFLVLIASTVCLLFISYLYLSSLLQRQKFVLPTLRSSAETSVVDNSTMSNEVASANREVVVPRFIYNSIFYFGYALLFIVSLLWIRVLFETIIMVFSIGSHLRDSKSRK